MNGWDNKPSLQARNDIPPTHANMDNWDISLFVTFSLQTWFVKGNVFSLICPSV